MSIEEAWKEEGLPVFDDLDQRDLFEKANELDKAHCFFRVGYLAGLKRAEVVMKANLESFLED